jgi:hypothetical protein
VSNLPKSLISRPRRQDSKGTRDTELPLRKLNLKRCLRNSLHHQLWRYRRLGSQEAIQGSEFVSRTLFKFPLNCRKSSSSTYLATDIIPFCVPIFQSSCLATSLPSTFLIFEVGFHLVICLKGLERDIDIQVKSKATSRIQRLKANRSREVLFHINKRWKKVVLMIRISVQCHRRLQSNP